MSMSGSIYPGQIIKIDLPKEYADILEKAKEDGKEISMIAGDPVRVRKNTFVREYTFCVDKSPSFGITLEYEQVKMTRWDKVKRWFIVKILHYVKRIG